MGVERRTVTIDGNEAAARVAHRLNEVIAIYPITPSTPMGELADLWSSQGKTNLWGAVPLVAEMQAEGGAAGAVHGALQAGALTTTFTGSQGLLLMIPNMYKIAGELTAAVFHVAARSVAAQALSIFGDHSDVMAARQTGFAMLAAGSVQEAHDFAAIAQAATLRARVPFMHFFEGFRTSHEINKIEILSDDVLRALIDDELVHAHRERALNPDRPVVRGTAQNPDVFFQARESVNRFYIACPGIVQETMEQFGALTGRRYRLFEYSGAQDAERVVILMGSGAETAHATVDRLVAAGEAVGVLKVRLYRPFDARAFAAALPPTVRAVAVLDRTKEPGATGEPLYLDVVAALHEQWADSRGMPVVIGGRYGLSSKEFTPAMVKAVFDELGRPHPKNHFTVGITDDVTHTSLPFDPEWSIESSGTVRAVFYGLGSDGTVSANKNSIKIIGEETPNYAQGYFVYDSKKAGSQTVSHLRFGPDPIRAPYLVQSANFIGCHQFSFLERFDPLRPAEPGSILLINTPYTNHETWEHLPRHVQETIIEKRLRVFAINAYKVAQHTGMGRRINTIMQTCFFALMDKAADVRLLNTDDAIAAIKIAIKKTYGKAGAQAVLRNYDAIGQALDYLREVEVPPAATSDIKRRPPVSDLAPEFVRAITARMLDGQGDRLPVSALPIDGTYPIGTARWEKRAIATEIPVWDEELCIQCGKCVLVCPHAVVRMKVYDPKLAEGAPPGFKSVAARFREYRDQAYTLQVAPEDCTGCGLCVEACPVKNKRAVRLKAINMHPLHGDGADGSLLKQEKANWEFFLNLPAVDMAVVRLNQVKYSQLRRPLFEFSGACAGCGETPYLKLLSQLFGDRAIIANATGCSSIYGGNLPTTPWASNSEGRGPAWSNSLFEDNAEFGFGMRLALDQRLAEATELLRGLRAELGAELADAVLNADQSDAAGIGAQRQRVEELKARLQEVGPAIAPAQQLHAARLSELADIFVQKSVWIVGGDGWAYDIGYGGLDHVLASHRNVNVLVLDTEVYSNTGGQMSKATPRGAVAKFASGGKVLPKKDLGLHAMGYGHIYVARIAMGANDGQTLRAFLEAEAYEGPALLIAYSHCIAHGYDLRHGLDQQKAAVKSGYWPLYRFDPRRAANGENPMQLDSKPPALPLADYMYEEGRFRILQQRDPQSAARLLELAQEDVQRRWDLYTDMAARSGA